MNFTALAALAMAGNAVVGEYLLALGCIKALPGRQAGQ